MTRMLTPARVLTATMLYVHVHILLLQRTRNTELLDDIGLQEVAEMTRHHDLWQAVPIKQGLWRSLFGAPPARSTSSAILGVDLQEFKNAAEACEEVCCTAAKRSNNCYYYCTAIVAAAVGSHK
jgi:hypothetical protein